MKLNVDKKPSRKRYFQNLYSFEILRKFSNRALLSSSIIEAKRWAGKMKLNVDKKLSRERYFQNLYFAEILRKFSNRAFLSSSIIERGEGLFHVTQKKKKKERYCSRNDILKHHLNSYLGHQNEFGPSTRGLCHEKSGVFSRYVRRFIFDN